MKHPSRPIIIKTVTHRAVDGWCVCNKTLNNLSWNTTEHKTFCKVCYPRSKQLELFNEIKPICKTK